MRLTSCVLDNPIQITIVIVRPAALSKNDQIWPKIGIFVHFWPGLAGSFGALLVAWLVVVARGQYLARHLFTLSFIMQKNVITQMAQTIGFGYDSCKKVLLIK